MDFKKVPIPIERGSGGYSTREAAEKALKGIVMVEIDVKAYIEGILDCYNLTFSDFIQFCADNRLFEACALQKELKWWEEEDQED